MRWVGAFEAKNGAVLEVALILLILRVGVNRLTVVRPVKGVLCLGM